MPRWQLQEAKARFSELIRKCASGPQIVSKSGKDQAVVLTIGDYERLIGKKMHLVDFINSSPIKGVKLDLTRDKTSSRDIEL